MTPPSLPRAWIALLGLSLGSTLIAALVGHGMGRTAVGAAILALAWMKARIILSRYLGLWQAPGWRVGFNWALGFFCLILLGLFLVPAFAN